ncbi:MAG: TolC family outer membrane protein [Burkholderiales bacterium]|jgi:outer membrane protein|nr:TolC family outer membrane protein [Burkholderiales bacterium]
MKRIARLRGLQVVCLMLFCSTAFAEDLLQIYAEAHARDPGLQAAAALRDAATPRVGQAQAALGSSVIATAAANRGRSATSVESESTDAGTSTSNSWNTGIKLRKPLFNRAADRDVVKARLGIDIANADHDLAEQDFVLRVAQAYVDVLAGEDVLAAALANRRWFAAQLEATQLRFKAGNGIVTDVHDARARDDLAESQALTAESDLRVRRLVLTKLVGRPGVKPAPLAAAPFVAPPMPVSGDPMRVTADHPANRRLRLLVESAALDTQRARAGLLPTVDALASVGVGRTSATSTFPATTGRTYTVGVELNVPLYDSHATRDRTSEMQLLEQRARKELEASEQSVAETLERSEAELQSAHAQVRALETALASSRASLESSEVAYRAGVRLNLDVLNARAQLFQTERDLAKARYDLLILHLKLLRAAGTLKADSLALVNALLQR